MPDLATRQTNSQLELAAQAARGDESARREVNTLVAPIIDYQTSRFCKRFCKENRSLYRCTLKSPWGSAPEDASLCEWGNASYGWMLDDLASSARLQKYQARDDSSLYNYLFRIANSLPFYERWKDWRFGRKVHVPTYIRELDPLAARVFLEMRASRSPADMAQTLATDTATVEALRHRIISLLTRKHRLHLLNPERTVSLTQRADGDSVNSEDDTQLDIASFDVAPEDTEQQQMLRRAWKQMTAVEQYVLEALVIENQDAESVLVALRKLGLGIKTGVAPEDTDRQQLYYLRRKTLARLAELMRAQEAA